MSNRHHHSSLLFKDLWIVRHGQATHNPRAEAARTAGCSFEDFFELMRQDDALDSPLTDKGRQQAEAVLEQHRESLLGGGGDSVELVVSSPLSRALETANLAMPPTVCSSRICYEGFREINGVLKNAQRRCVSDLTERFPGWNFDNLTTEDDAAWTADEIEDHTACGHRGFTGLQWLWEQRDERRILLVAHGGILRYTLEHHPNVFVHDGRKQKGNRPVLSRFGNGELRRYRLSCGGGNIVLTEVDLDGSLGTQEKQQKGLLN